MAGYQGQPHGENTPLLPSGWGPAVVVLDGPQLLACLDSAAGRAVTLVSPFWLTARFGPGYLAGLLAPRRAPGIRLPGIRLLVEAGDAAGFALAALRAGADGLVLDPGLPAWPAIAEAAGPAPLLPALPPLLELGDIDARRPAARARLAARLDAWLGAGIRQGG